MDFTTVARRLPAFGNQAGLLADHPLRRWATIDLWF